MKNSFLSISFYYAFVLILIFCNAYFFLFLETINCPGMFLLMSR